MEQFAFGRASDSLVSEVRRMARLVDGRWSCRHPDGSVRMLRSALRVFGSDVERHRHKGCLAAESAALG